MSSLNCPKCSGRLEPIVYQQIEIDRCQQCGGIWFDSQEADILSKMKGSDQLDLGEEETTSQLNLIEEEVNCPRCQEPMIRMVDMDEYNIWYEKCLECGGFWLDAGEFRQFKRNFTPNKLLNSLKKLFKRQQ